MSRSLVQCFAFVSADCFAFGGRLVFGARRVSCGRFGGASRGGADAVPGWASMLAVPPAAALLFAAPSSSGGCATRPSGSDMLAIPLLAARGKPDLPCAATTPTRRPARHRIGSCHPARGMPRPAAGACPDPKPCGISRSAVAWLSEPWHAPSRAKKGLGRHPAGRLVGAEKRSVEVGVRQHASSSSLPGLFERS